MCVCVRVCVCVCVCVCAQPPCSHLLVEPCMEYPPLSWLGPVPPAAGGERGVLIREDGLVLSDDVKQVDTTQFNHLHDVVVCWGGEERRGE